MERKTILRGVLILLALCFLSAVGVGTWRHFRDASIRAKVARIRADMPGGANYYFVDTNPQPLPTTNAPNTNAYDPTNATVDNSGIWRE